MRHLLRTLLALLLTITLRLSSTPISRTSHQYLIHIHTHSIPLSSPSHHQGSRTITCKPILSSRQSICVVIIGRYNHEVPDKSPGLMYKAYT